VWVAPMKGKFLLKETEMLIEVGPEKEKSSSSYIKVVGIKLRNYRKGGLLDSSQRSNSG